MSGFPSRDLTAHDLWDASLVRSRARRRRAVGGRGAPTEPSLAALIDIHKNPALIDDVRNLADSEPWELSLGRSRARRRAAELRFVPTSSRAKRISLGALAALTAGPTSSLADGTAAPHPGAAPNPEPPTTSEHHIVLTTGSRGRQVRLLQQALGVASDGVYGPRTEAAVRQFQASRGLTVDNIVGPRTSVALSSHAPAVVSAAVVRTELSGEAEVDARASDAAQGVAEVPATQTTTSSQTSGSSTENESGDSIARLQRTLHLAVDGDFGPQTEAAIRRLQARHGLTVDGVVGPATWSAIGMGAEQHTLTPPPSARPASAHRHRHRRATAVHGGASENAPASVVTRLQQALHLQADGTFGPQTEAAIRRLQARHGLTVDGVVGPATWSAIGMGAEQHTLTPPPSAVSQHRSSAEADPSSTAGGGESSSVVARVVAAGNEIATRPYVFGGGHGSFQSTGYDCSGSVSYALHGGGLLSSPEDSSALESFGEAGPGSHITIYANAEHAFMVIDGRRFDTVAQQETGSRWADSMTSTAGYVVRHPAGM
jgi:peptidoglycan hydrolase-like protein with peptidoglycan-binding domain